MKNLTTIERKIAELETLAKQVRAERKDVVARIKLAIKQYTLTDSELFGRRAKKAPTAAVKKPVVKNGAKKSKPKAKYRDGESGSAWSGRGPKPKWLQEKLAEGFILDDFLVR